MQHMTHGRAWHLQVDSARGAVRHNADTREEWQRTVSKIGRDFLVKEVHHQFDLLCPSCKELHAYLMSSPALTFLSVASGKNQHKQAMASWLCIILPDRHHLEPGSRV